MVDADPDVPHAFPAEGKKLIERGCAAQLESLRRVVGGERRGVRLAPCLEAQQPLVLGVEIEEQTVADFQRLGRAAAFGVEAQHRVGAVAVVVDEMFGGSRRAGRGVGPQCNPRQRVRGDLGVLRFQLAPGDFAVAVSIQPDRDFEIAHRDVPLAGDARAVHRERKVTVARLVRVRRAERRDGENQRHEPPSRDHLPSFLRASPRAR